VRRVRNVDGVVVENKVDPARVFTAPLSLHRERDMVCVCIDPDKLYDFTPDDALPGRFKHFTGWSMLRNRFKLFLMLSIIFFLLSW
jgi:hypothetical protein